MRYTDMDIYSKEGTKVTPNYKDGKPVNGSEYDAKKVLKHLQHGQWYTVQSTDVGNWSTDVYLKEFPGIPFNSVNLLVAEESDEHPTPSVSAEEVNTEFRMIISHALLGSDTDNVSRETWELIFSECTKYAFKLLNQFRTPAPEGEKVDQVEDAML